MFKDIAAAYQVLSDKEKRKRYDMGIDDESGADFSGFRGAGVNPFDLFRNFFGSNTDEPEEDQGSRQSGGRRFGYSSFPGSFGGFGMPGGSQFSFKFG